MSKDTDAAARLAKKRKAWLERTMLALDVSEEQALRLLQQDRVQSLRVNTLIAPPEETLVQLSEIGWHGKPFEWAPHCFTIDNDMAVVRDSALVAAGAVFIQNAASWLPVLALDPQPGDTVLDVCAAPGGKASHIAEITNNLAHIWVNDNSRPRLAKMRANFQRLGVIAEDYTLFDSTQLARRLNGRQFNKILLDAPCSGEGMMRYDRDKDFATWSVAHIKRLQQLQKQIILQAWQLLAVGGTLVYSTCTMAPEENEAVVDYLLRKRADAAVVPLESTLPNKVPAVTSWNGRSFTAEVQGSLRLVPSPHVESFFVCKLKKLAPSEDDMYTQQRYEQ
jgi:16S rRNA (cytosine1407-C5)-methyltransferase